MADELKTDIEQYESNWVLFEQFNNGLGELTKEDWISFRLVGYCTSVVVIHLVYVFSFLIGEKAPANSQYSAADVLSVQ